MKFHYKGNYTWDIQASWGTYEHSFHLNVEHLNTNWTWVAIDPEDGKVHITDNIFDEGKEHNNWKPIHIHFDEFPKNTRVGWRGPVMLWEKVKNMPQIFWKFKN